MWQHLRFDKGNVTLSTGASRGETIGGVQAAWTAEVTEAYERSKEPGFFEWATGQKPALDSDPLSATPFHDTFPAAPPQHRLPSLGRSQDHWALRSRQRGEVFTYDPTLDEHFAGRHIAAGG